MSENLFNSSHKATNEEYRDGYERTFGKRLCTCGHAIESHEDYDFNIHECTHLGCDCQQFVDKDQKCQD